jgi:hypothetical protein
VEGYAGGGGLVAGVVPGVDRDEAVDQVLFCKAGELDVEEGVLCICVGENPGSSYRRGTGLAGSSTQRVSSRQTNWFAL